jgi:hypothetical protein
MAKAEWRRLSEAFDEDQDAIRIYTTTAAADSEYAEQLLLDPLPLLVENIPEVAPDWSVSLERVNGEVGVGRLKPPRKALITWTVMPALSEVHGVLFRLPPTTAS